MNSERSTLRGKQAISAQTTIPDRLRIQWWTVCLCCVSVALVCFFVLRSAWQPGYAQQWLLQTFAVLVYVLGTLRSCLPANHRKYETLLLPTFGAGTLITICRGGLISMLAGFLFLPWPESSSGMLRLSWLPGALYILAALADYADGYLARITKHETRLGEVFDAKMDALGLLIAPLLAISFGQLPIYYVAVGAAYYVFIFGIWLRKKSGRPLVELQPYPEARMLAGFQMGFIGVALLPVFSPPVTTIAALIFMTPFLIGFVRDWLVVCGRIHTDSSQWVRRERDIHTWLTKYLPLCLRFSMLWAGWRIFRHGMLPFSPDVAIILNRTLSMTEAMGYAWNSLVFMMIMFGIMGRVAALLIGISTGFTIMRCGSSGTFVLMFSCALAVMLNGTGALSVWQPEDSFLFKRAGERE